MAINEERFGAMQRTAHAFAVVAPQPTVRTGLDIAGLSDFMSIQETREAAFRARRG